MGKVILTYVSMIVERNTRGRREKQGGLLKSAKNTLGEHGARESRVKKLVEVVKEEQDKGKVSCRNYREKHR
jgi:hypothetical protein